MVLTLMLRCVPRHFTLQDLLGDLDPVLPTMDVNFVHLPQDARRSGNITLAFLSFESQEAASRAAIACSGRKWSGSPGSPACLVTAARIQGFEENLAHYLRRAARPGHGGGPPLLLRGGRPMSLQDAVAAMGVSLPTGSVAAVSQQLLPKYPTLVPGAECVPLPRWVRTG
mmetsp:Transcript_101058/g.292261  ORF Transcript_101058/g.292261 Transcript_101058/m.292261 type:complete len:170 (+) Transcript_101058:76-585(+)